MRGMSIEKIVVKTGIAEKAGLHGIDGIEYSDLESYLLDNIERLKTDYIALIPDISVSLAEYILHSIGNLLEKDVDVIIVVSKPRGIFGRVLSRLGALEVLEKITGHPHGYLIVFRRELLNSKNPTDQDIITRILSRSRRIYSIVYEIPLSEHALAVYGKLPYPIVLLLKEPNRVIRFGIVGSLGALVNVSTVVISANILGYTSEAKLLLIPVFLGFEASIVFNFILHELWTFREMDLPRGFLDRLRRLFKYHIASIVSLIIQSSTVLLLTGLFSINLALSDFIGILLGFIANYIIGRTITWRYK